MSRGLGRIESAVAGAFITQPDRALTVAELAVFVYPRASPIEKRHRVAILRAADKVAARMGRERTVGGSPREVRYAKLARQHGASTLVLDRPVQDPASLDPIVADHVAENVIRFLRSVLDQRGLEAFIHELDRTSVDRLRAHL